MPPLFDDLRATPVWPSSLAAASGGTPTLAQLSAALDDLRATIEGGGMALAPSVPVATQAAAIAALGESIAARAKSGEIAATRDELAAVNAWVRARLLDCVDALARQREAVAAREATLRSLFVAAGIVVVEIDDQFRFRWVYDRTGPSARGDIIGQTIWDVADPIGAENVAVQMRRVFSTGAGLQTELTVVPRDVGPRNLLLAIEPTRDAAGAVTGVIGVSTDITELKKTQEQLGKAVVFREQMMAVLAHDLRNPLSAVCGISSIFARKESLPAEVRQGLVHIERAGKRMDELIGTLLDFSAARFNGAIPLSPGSADLAEIARGVLDELRQAMPDRRIEVESHGETRGRFDGARIAQVISNLASNALNHGARSQPVRVLIDGRAPDLALSVSNAGKPIPPELIPALFEPFRRGTPGPDRPRGLGLGLYIAQQIARGHGGALELESSTEEGTVFTLRLPRA